MHRNYVLRTLLFSSLISVVFLSIRMYNYRNFEYLYLIWNLILAWLPLISSWNLQKSLKKLIWSSWFNLCLTALWLVFLPNSFYIITDFIHLQDTASYSLLYDAVMILSFTLNGLLLGYLSVYIVHQLLLARISKVKAQSIIGIVFLASSFAIYLGRYMRWNSWDIIINPAGILFDVSDRLLNPFANPQTFSTTLLFFFFISTTYIIIGRFVEILKLSTHK